MRVPSGKTDVQLYFVAVDATDLKTRETGLATWTVVRSRNGAADATYTTPTITEIDATTMPGVYALLLDEDTTITSGADSEETCIHITHTGMAPVTRTYELYRRTATSGEALTVASGVGSANAVQLSGDSTAADNAEAFFDGTGYAGTNNVIPLVTTTTTATNVTTVNGLAANVITAASIANGAIDAATFAAGAIDAAAIANGAIDAATFAAGAIDAAAIANGAIDAATFAAGAIDAAALAADAGTEIGTAVWATAARTLTAATNITSTGGSVPVTAGGLVSSDVTAISTDTAAADNAEAFFDGTGYAGTGNVIPTVTTLTNLPAITANWLTAAGTAADFGTEVSNAVWAKTLTELTGVPAANAAVIDALNLLFMALRNQRATTATADVITNDAGATIATATLSDNGTTFTKTEYV